MGNTATNEKPHDAKKYRFEKPFKRVCKMSMKIEHL